MTRNIGTDAVNDQIRATDRGTHPSAPTSGNKLIYVISGSPHGGLYVEDSSGNKIGPMITGSSSSATFDSQLSLKEQVSVTNPPAGYFALAPKTNHFLFGRSVLGVESKYEGVQTTEIATPQVSGTASKTEMFTASVPSGTLYNSLGNGGVYVECLIITQNDSGVNRTITITVDWGVTTIHSTAFNIISSGNAALYYTKIHITGNGGTAQQIAAANTREVRNLTANGTTGSVSITEYGTLFFPTEDTTASKDIVISVTHSNNAVTIRSQVVYAFSSVKTP